MVKKLKFQYSGSFAAVVANAKFYLEHRAKPNLRGANQEFADYIIADGQPFTLKLTVSVTPDKAIGAQIDVYDRPVGEGGSVMLEHALGPMTFGEFSGGRVMTAIRRVVKRSETLSKLRAL